MTDSPPPAVDRCQDLWYRDGTIILEAESTQFRVYGGILADNSPVFNDMFAIPQPTTEGSTANCPVVHLQDPKSDLFHFLKTLHCAG